MIKRYFSLCIWCTVRVDECLLVYTEVCWFIVSNTIASTLIVSAHFFCLTHKLHHRAPIFLLAWYMCHFWELFASSAVKEGVKNTRIVLLVSLCSYSVYTYVCLISTPLKTTAEVCCTLVVVHTVLGSYSCVCTLVSVLVAWLTGTCSTGRQSEVLLLGGSQQKMQLQKHVIFQLWNGDGLCSFVAQPWATYRRSRLVWVSMAMAQKACHGRYERLNVQVWKLHIV